MVEIETRIRATGNGYCLYIPSALIKCKVLDPSKKIKAILEQKQEVVKKVPYTTGLCPKGPSHIHILALKRVKEKLLAVQP